MTLPQGSGPALTPPAEARVDLAGGEVEVLTWAGPPGKAAIVLLHEGLGSARLWRTFPSELAACSGRTVVAWSRHGYGTSAVTSPSRPPGYMHEEALTALPTLLAALGLEAPVLVGHSDGASIALIHAGAGHPVAGIVAIAPHVLVEEISLTGIRAARDRYETGDLRDRLARHHADPDAAFRGWNDVWLSDGFRDWNIEEFLPAVRCPVLAVQAADDDYGTLEQVDRIAAAAGGPVRRLILPAGGHAPHLTRPGEVVAAVGEFLAGLP